MLYLPLLGRLERSDVHVATVRPRVLHAAIVPFAAVQLALRWRWPGLQNLHGVRLVAGRREEPGEDGDEAGREITATSTPNRSTAVLSLSDKPRSRSLSLTRWLR
jgi:hypothetical protein